jgi:hypothetical protein
MIEKGYCWWHFIKKIKTMVKTFAYFPNMKFRDKENITHHYMKQITVTTLLNHKLWINILKNQYLILMAQQYILHLQSHSIKIAMNLKC